ncbi:MAG: hypothetical protein E6K53_00510 [Gammaproteobacteria bacterium]|nr:MAG: hypothetical protein E6K53_00510 [Gammaproteobacteria bacterium]
MAAKQTKGNKGTLLHTPAEQIHRIWLAGLGTIAIAYQRGGEWFARVVEEGRDLQARSTTFAQEAAADLQVHATGIFAPLQSRFEKQAAQYGTKIESGVASILGKLGVPAKREIEQLNRDIAALTRKLRTAK